MSKSEMTNVFMRSVLVLLFSFAVLPGLAIDASDRYRSPRNPERKIRQSTLLIVLHTTEAPARSSLNKLSDRGEAHFCVTEVGQVYRIVDRDREAFHAGRSMWNGKEDVDKFSIGIECVGYHDKPMPTVQLVAIRDLVKELQSMYRISDDRVVCHSHVAYGAPNKWQKHRHRGRKRCGMLFAMPSVRKMLQLKSKPAYDPDTRVGRLTVGDDYLRKVLYTGVDTMSGRYGAGQVMAVAPTTGGSWFSRLFGNTAAAAPTPAASPPATPVAETPSSKRPPPRSVVQRSPAAGKSSRPIVPKSVAHLKSGGWVCKGAVSKNNTALKLAGSKWNAADTYYTIRDKVVPGNQMNPSKIEKGMCVWMKK